MKGVKEIRSYIEGQLHNSIFSPVYKIAISLDVSGSMSSSVINRISKILSHIKNTSVANIEFIVIPFNTEVLVDSITRLQQDELKTNISLAGGTNLQVAVDFAERRRREFYGHIIFSDFYAPEPVGDLATIFVAPSESYNKKFKYPVVEF